MEMRVDNQWLGFLKKKLCRKTFFPVVIMMGRL